MSFIEKLYLRRKNNLAYNDICTGAKNRNYFEAVIKNKYLDKDVYITVLDINGFKEINDTYGHLTGDCALKALGGLLQSLRNVYEVCRYGGDEFVVVHDKVTNLAEGCQLYTNLTGYSFCYGTYHKLATESVLTAFEKADKLLYDTKKKHWVTNDRRKKTDKVLVELSRVGDQFSELRAGQLIYDAICKTRDDLYYISDAEFKIRLQQFVENMKDTK